MCKLWILKILKMPGRRGWHGNRHRSPHGTPLVDILLHGSRVLRIAWHICGNGLPLSHLRLNWNQTMSGPVYGKNSSLVAIRLNLIHFCHQICKSETANSKYKK